MTDVANRIDTIMKTLRYFLVPVCGLLLMFSACKKTETAEIGALPCRTASGQPAFVKSDGEVLDLHLTGLAVGPLVNGFFTAATPDGVTVYHMTPDGPEIVEGLSGLRSAGFMAYGVMPVCRPGRHIELVDAEGVTVASVEVPDGEVTESAPSFVDGVLAVTTDSGLSGLVDTKGNFIVSPRFASLGPVSGGMMIAMTDAETDNGGLTQLFSVIDVKGNVVFSFPDSMVPVCEIVSDGKVPVRTASGFAVADVTAAGALTPLPASVRRIEDAADGLIVFRDSSGKRGLMDYSGNVIVAPVYSALRIGPGGTVAASDGTVWSLIGRDGAEISALPEFTVVSPAPRAAYAAGFAFVGRTADGFWLVGENGEKVNSSPFESVDYSRLLTQKVTTDYPVRTAPVELPGEEDAVGD